MMDVSSCVDSFDLPVTLLRSSAGAYDSHGRYVGGAVEEFALRMVIAPATTRDLQVLPEGLRNEETLVFFSKHELRSALAGAGGVVADSIVYQGSTYELQHVESWEHQGGFWRALGIRREQ